MKKIAYICGNYNPKNCGVSDYVKNLSFKLADYYDYEILTSYSSLIKNKVEKTVGATEDWTLNNIMKLSRKIITSDFDLVHLHYSEINFNSDKSIFIMPFIFKFLKSKKPIVLTIHEWPYVFKDNPFIIKANDALIVTNKSLEKIMTNYKRKIYQIPITSSIRNKGMDKNKARKIVFEKYGWKECNLIIYFGFLNPVKNLEMLIEVFKEIADKENIRLFIVGGIESLSLPGEKGFKYLKKIKEKIKKEKLINRVIITGYLPEEEVSLFLKASDFGVLPSKLGVGIKNSAFQTMIAHGLPVVASYHPMAGEEILDYEFISVFKPNDKNGLKEKIIFLLKNVEIRNQNARKSFDLAQNYNWNKILKEHLDLYKLLLP